MDKGGEAKLEGQKTKAIDHASKYIGSVEGKIWQLNDTLFFIAPAKETK